MSLDVVISCFGLPGIRRGRVEFRGVHYDTRTLTPEEADGALEVDERFQWLLASALKAEEVLSVDVFGGSWGRRPRGHLVLSLDKISSNPGKRIDVQLPLFDQRKKPRQAKLTMYMEYTAPESCDLFLAPDLDASGTDTQISEDERMSENHMSEDELLLEGVQKNIERLEKGLASTSQEPSTSRFQFNRPNKSYRGDGKRISTLRTVRNLMRLGKRRPSNCSSSTDDEERDLMSPPPEENAAPTTSSAQEANSTDKTPDDNTMSFDRQIAKRRSFPSYQTMSSSLLKCQDFQVCLTILEARKLAGINMDPVVCIQVGDCKRYTSVKESTNCPYYNEYFVFDFYIPPILLFDKIIMLTVLQARNVFRPNKMLGSFKLDVGTAWAQPEHQFYHKWAVLTDPFDPASGPKGYLKCDISVIGKGDSINIPQKSDRDQDDIESNLLLPEGVPTIRQRARYIVRIHKADGLPKMNLSLMANMKKALTGESKDLVDPFVEVSFAGLSGCTSVQKNNYNPVWNEQIVFTDMFPPLCQRIKIQLIDHDPVKPNVIGTHFIDLKSISNDGEKGFLPTFGPAHVYMYGSLRDYTILDQHAQLNSGLGEGVSYRARLLISIRTEVAESPEAISSTVETEFCPPPSDRCCPPDEEFFLFSSIMEASMIDKKFIEKPITFEISMGNAGNTIDGQNQSSRPSLDPPDTERDESLTQPAKAMSHDRIHYFLPYWDRKPCMHVRSPWPDHTERLYASNMIENLAECLEEGITLANEKSEDEAVQILRATLNELHLGCNRFLEIRRAFTAGHSSTELDKKRTELCHREIQNMSAKSRHLKAIVTKNSYKERNKTAYSFLKKLKFLIEDPQGSLPDIVLWAIAGGKRLAYQRIPARFLIYSDIPEEKGKLCGKTHTMLLKLPGKKADGPGGWTVPIKLLIFIWLGHKKFRIHYPEGLPGGYSPNRELQNSSRYNAIPPQIITYVEQHHFQLRAYLYQARSLIGSDASGLSDPFARVIAGEFCKTTRVIDETLSPTWDQSLLFTDITIYGPMEQIKEDPLIIIIEIFDQDQVGKSEFIGRAIAKPRVKSMDEPYVKPSFPPALEWFEITRGTDHAGELLAAFELLEIGYTDSGEPGQPPGVPQLPPPKENEDIIPIPESIRPTLANYRIEVLFWGLRDLKRVHFLSVDKPRVDIECAGNILCSSVIQNAKRNPNFSSSVKYLDMELPEEEIYKPPLTIRVVDCRSFGRNTLVGTHTINSIHKYMHTFPTAKEKEMEERRKSAQRRQDLEDEDMHLLMPETKIQIENDKDSAPLIYKEGSMIYSNKKRDKFSEENKRPRQSMAEDVDDEESSVDWWTKYFASVENMAQTDKDAKTDLNKAKNSLSTDADVAAAINAANKTGARSKEFNSDNKKHKFKSTATNLKVGNKFINSALDKKKALPKDVLCKVYPSELESQNEFGEFKEWLMSFDLYRGKRTGDEIGDENRIVGVFKGAIKVYKWPLPTEERACLSVDPHFGVFQNVPNNDPIRVLVRVYIIKANDLHPMDLNGKADPYIVLQLGPKKISDKDNYISKQLNPVFGKCFELEATFPRDSVLTVKIQDWDLVGSDDIIGETRIDIENRFYSRHRGSCGIPIQYEEQGFNRWRDTMKPSQILGKLCKDNKIEPPTYELGRVKVGRKIFEIEGEEFETWTISGERCREIEEKMALKVLHRWSEYPIIGCELVPEHIETRALYCIEKPGIERGKLEMWVDLFPMDLPSPGPSIDISPRKPRSYELRIIIWNTDDVVLEDDAFFTGEKMSDIYVKGWLKGPEDCQSTDIHYRSLTGEGNFNWRFIYPFDYLFAEEKIVISRKESLFSWDETKSKIPARLEFQVWDADHFSADDFLGAITLDLNRFPRGAKSSKLCTLDMLKTDGSVPMVNIFKQRRVKGWWPFYIKKENDELELTGKVEAEIHLLTKEEAEKNPVGLGRSEPDPLDRPNRPDASFMWFLNPLKSIRYIVWHNYKWKVLKALIILGITVLLLLFFYAIPGYTVKRFLGA